MYFSWLHEEGEGQERGCQVVCPIISNWPVAMMLQRLIVALILIVNFYSLSNTQLMKPTAILSRTIRPEGVCQLGTGQQLTKTFGLKCPAKYYSN